MERIAGGSSGKGNIMNIIKFEAGKSYQVRSIGDRDCVWTFEVLKRTEKSIWVRGSEHKNKRLGISIYNGEEMVKPFGTFSMAPTLCAGGVVK